MITIVNQGQILKSTNYWDSELARNGYFFLSWNAGAGRLLIPDAHKASIREMKTGREVIISRGKLDGRDALELMFEDGSDSPYCIHLVAEQCDRLIPDTDQGGGFVVALWTRGGMKLRIPGRYRVVEALPCLDPWRGQ